MKQTKKVHIESSLNKDADVRITLTTITKLMEQETGKDYEVISFSPETTEDYWGFVIVPKSLNIVSVSSYDDEIGSSLRAKHCDGSESNLNDRRQYSDGTNIVWVWSFDIDVNSRGEIGYSKGAIEGGILSLPESIRSKYKDSNGLIKELLRIQGVN